MLTIEIIKHIYKKLGLLQNLNKFYSILDDKFLLDKKISLIDEDNNTIHNSMWCLQLNYEDKKIRLLAVNCSLSNEPEYALLVSLDDAPTFACYLSSDENDGVISYFVNNNWSQASVYLQANFLAGMEQFKEIFGEWKVCEKFDDLNKNMILFINHCDGVLDAG